MLIGQGCNSLWTSAAAHPLAGVLMHCLSSTHLAHASVGAGLLLGRTPHPSEFSRAQQIGVTKPAIRIRPTLFAATHPRHSRLVSIERAEEPQHDEADKDQRRDVVDDLDNCVCAHCSVPLP